VCPGILQVHERGGQPLSGLGIEHDVFTSSQVGGSVGMTLP
jgi:hypothetical protein